MAVELKDPLRKTGADTEVVPQDLPIGTVPDRKWQRMVEVGRKMAEVIDQHTDAEGERRQQDSLRVSQLCPVQRQDLVSDLEAVRRSGG